MVSRDLNEAEFAELNELLAATPPPLMPLDVVMLDGFLCGVLVQPVLLTPPQWLPHVFDLEATPLPDSCDSAWRERTRELVVRRYTALNQALVEDGWFEPVILEAENEQEEEVDDAVARDAAREQVGSAAATTTTAPASSAPSGSSAITHAIAPWVAGFQHALLRFPTLIEQADDDVKVALTHVSRHLPAETDEEREWMAVLDRDLPLATLDDAIDALVNAVADLADLTRAARFHVDTVKRDTPKVGRNDACPCGSGKKFKHCHGAA